MAKAYTGPFISSSHHRVYLTSTVNDIERILGKPVCEDNTGEDKVNFEWDGITSTGIIFTVYDWKQYRPIGRDEVIEWNIGGQNFIQTHDALEELLRDIHNAKAEDERLKSGLGKEEYGALSEIEEINKL